VLLLALLALLLLLVLAQSCPSQVLVTEAHQTETRPWVRLLVHHLLMKEARQAVTEALLAHQAGAD
jgi:hypothetical protein